MAKSEPRHPALAYLGSDDVDSVKGERNRELADQRQNVDVDRLIFKQKWKNNL